ncbi:hypothetical protein [Streptomyces sp. NPDC020983]|uniref:hypothetical protein n=1 Tax=Streptomyces sp. NPDC020983 TaxID=3365106 RepID=UPI0037B17628
MAGKGIGGGVRAVLVGAVLGAVWVSAAVPVSDGLCHSSGADAEDYGCLGIALVFRPAAALAGGLLAWALLALFRVPRATRTAGAGFGVCLLLVWAHDYVADSLHLFGAVTDDAVLLAAGYGLAHVLVAAGTSPRVRAGVGAALLAVWPLSAAVRAGAVDHAERHALDGVSVPLLAPGLPGYRALFPLPASDGKGFAYLLLADGTPASADDRDRHGAWVTVEPRPASFAPPRHCDAGVDGVAPHVSSCTPVAAHVWRVRRYGTRWYVVRPPGRDALVFLRTEGTAVPEKDILALAADLQPREAGFFHDHD